MPHIFRLTTEQMIVRYVDDEMSLSTIAEEAKCSISTVHRRLRNAGVTFRPAVTPHGIRTKRVSDEELAETVRLYMMGFSIDEVGEMLNLSTSGVWYRLHKMAGIKMRGPGGQIFGRSGRRLPHHALERVKTLYTAGLSSTEVGEVLSISSCAVRWRLKVAGVPIRSRNESLQLRWARRPKQRKEVKT